MARVRNQEAFIAKARKIHGQLYDYSLVVYKSSKIKVKIICRKCGHIFEQAPNTHLNGSGCPNCALRNQTGTLEHFLKRAYEVHGKGRYDYSLVVYINNKTKVTIICNVCGHIFQQTPGNHLMGVSCPKCKDKTLTQEEVIKRFRIVHGDLYDYSLVVYKNAYTKVKIICRIHGIFEQDPSSHIKGCGCPKCGGTGKLTTEEFIRKAKLIHGDFYDYSKSKYVNSRTTIEIICPVHGVFKQAARAHLEGKGCKRCSFGLKRSKGEIAMCEYIKSLYFNEVLENDRSQIKPFELDVYIPGLKLAFEYNGDYWHELQEENHPGYHENKRNRCKEKGIKLIEILDTQWRKNNTKMKNLIKETILGK